MWYIYNVHVTLRVIIIYSLVDDRLQCVSGINSAKYSYVYMYIVQVRLHVHMLSAILHKHTSNMLLTGYDNTLLYIHVIMYI